MNEAQTRFNKIDTKLRDAGWGIVPGSKILVEQSAYIEQMQVLEDNGSRILLKL
jgi:type I site-specific restriction endonuclease